MAMNKDNHKPDNPYKATQMWTEVIHAFKTGIPLKKHWKHMRQYENCFNGQEAVDWLFNWLKNNPDFASKVSREQTRYLLHKLFRAGVFVDVNSKRQEGNEAFKENGRLYRISNTSPLKILRTPGRPPLWNKNREHRPGGLKASPRKKSSDKENVSVASEHLSTCHIISKILSVEDVHHIWKTTTLGRLQSLLNLSSLDAFLNCQEVKGSWIVHNMTRLSENGVVVVLDKNDDLPHWVLSAMKCLINWPIACGSGSCLPNYPGFETDVFNVVKDYFTSLDKPLTTHELYDAFVSCFIQAELLDISYRSESHSHITASPSIEDILVSLTSFDCLKTSTPNYVYNPQTSVSKSGVRKSPSYCHSLNRSQTRNRSKFWESRTRVSHSGISPGSTPSGLCYETAFMPQGPVTRVISVDSMRRPCSIAVSSLQDDSPYSSANSQFSYNNRSSLNVRRKVIELNKKDYSRSIILENPSSPGMAVLSDKKSCDVNNKEIARYANLKEVSSILSQSAVNLSDQKDRTPYSIIPPYLGGGVLNHYRKSPSKRCISREITSSTLNAIKTSIPGLLTPEGKLRGIQVFQYLCLLLPPNNRKKLHLLLRFISKVCVNKRLSLTTNVPVRKMLLHTFSNYILLPPQEVIPDHDMAVRITSFLVQNYEDILRPPPLLISQVNDRISALQKSHLSYGVEANLIRYCHPITPAQYEEQRLRGSQQALYQLLQDIVQDGSITPREKRRKLKKFRQSHPSVYNEHFGADDPLNVPTNSKFPKFRSLTKLATLRL